MFSTLFQADEHLLFPLLIHHNIYFLTKNRIITLLKAGADAYVKDNSGKSAIDYAKEGGNKYIVDLLTTR